MEQIKLIVLVLSSISSITYLIVDENWTDVRDASTGQSESDVVPTKQLITDFTATCRQTHKEAGATVCCCTFILSFLKAKQK
jgi:hypothetical protein